MDLRAWLKLCESGSPPEAGPITAWANPAGQVAVTLVAGLSLAPLGVIRVEYPAVS